MEENQVFGKFNKGIFIFWKTLNYVWIHINHKFSKRICNICELMYVMWMNISIT